MGLRQAIERPLSELLGLVFPARCGACRRLIPPGEGALCPECGAKVLALADFDYCNRCGQSVGPFALRPTDQAGVRTCGLCDSPRLRYSALVRVGPYAEPLSGLIRRFKYHGGHHLTAALGEWQSARLAAQPWLDRVEALVPVPLHWRRRFGRGFNQSELLAEFASGRLGRPVVDALARPVHRPPQVSLPRSKRFENVRGVFAVRRMAHVRGARLCLIDDVCTTGATLSEAARTLAAGGAAAIYAAVVAVAQPPLPYSRMLHEP